MKLEKQVASLELSRRLKELGVKQKSLCYYNQDLWGDKPCYGAGIEGLKMADWMTHEYFSAFTVAELGEMLPYQIGKDRFNCHTMRIQNDKGMYLITYEKRIYQKGESEKDYTEFLASITERTEADARAKMLIYLLKNNLITLE